MEASWIGQSVSIYCNGKLGVFQGSIKDACNNQITITRAFRNGVPLRKQDAEITLSALDIKRIELLPTYNTPSTVIPTVINKPTPVKQPNFGAVKKQESQSTLTNKISNMKITNGQIKTPPVEKLSKLPPTNNGIHNISNINNSKTSPPSSSVAKFFGNMIPSKVEVKMGASLSSSHNQTVENGRNTSKPIDISKSLTTNNTPMKQNQQQTQLHQLQQTQMLANQDKKNKTQSRRDRDAKQFVNNQTFGTPIDDPIMGEEFDFEGNLALFDKRAIWNTIEAGQKPDLVRQVVSSQRNKKYRHDENVLASEPIQYRQIESYSQESTEFVTDEGLIIPTIPLSIRSKIQQIAEKNGLIWPRQCDILARGVADLAILLLGGARRLTPNNRHQWPKITIISDKSDDNKVSEIAAATGRQLAGHGLKVCLYIKEQSEGEIVEFELFKAATGNNIVNSVAELPSSDLVILSLSSNKLPSSVKRWLVENRSAILAVDPPVQGIIDVPIKCSILPILPLNNISLACGKLYLCNIGIPDKFYQDAGIKKYKSPFGHKFVIPIHMND